MTTEHTEDTPICHICHTGSRRRFWHTFSETFVDRAECRAQKAGHGVWLCTICEEGVHKWMKENADAADASIEAVNVMIGRLSDAIFKPRATRRRKPGARGTGTN